MPMFLFATVALAQPTTIDSLKSEISKVLEETHTPAAGIALVDKSGPILITSVGKARVKEDVAADSATMFRIGSVSKMFVSLSVLRLQEEGKLKLEDKVHDLVPELAFENQWEAEFPVRVVHLLEHTTGWDDLHLLEYAHNDSVPISTKDGLAFHPHSRKSRWVPGSRMSYCNSGPPAAALIVEKLTGMPFEQYVDQTFFRPMGMSTMTYFKSEAYNQRGANLYSGGVPQKYWHVLVRPSGSINASPADMARFIKFFLDRGTAGNTQLVSAESLTRMETPMSTPGAQAGMKHGYGLSNYTSLNDGFVWHGHNGGVNGGLTEFAYQPEVGVGYAVMINAGKGEALNKISKLVRAYALKGLDKKEASFPLASPEKTLDGYYITINPRVQLFYFLERIFSARKVWTDSSGVHSRNVLGGEVKDFIPANNLLYKDPQTGITSMALVSDRLAGEVLHMGTEVVRHSSVFEVFAPFIIMCVWILFLVTALIYGIVWVIRYFMRKIPSGINVQVRLYPLLASMFFVAAFIAIASGISDPIGDLGAPNLTTIITMLGTLGFGVCSVMSIYFVLRARRDNSINRVAYWHAAIGSVLHLIVAAYFLYWGVIGMRTWA
jgi:CubicO group peptidase (beta-lactamase class C family)